MKLSISWIYLIWVRVAQYEQFWKGNKDDRPRWSRNKGKEKNISFIEENSTRDKLSTSSGSEDSADETEVYTAEMVKNRQTYKCALLEPTRIGKSKAWILSYTYSFDIFKIDQIFDRLYKDRRIKLQEGQTLPSREELKKEITSGVIYGATRLKTAQPLRGKYKKK